MGIKRHEDLFTNWHISRNLTEALIPCVAESLGFLIQERNESCFDLTIGFS
jgi:hypothetical protein